MPRIHQLSAEILAGGAREGAVALVRALVDEVEVAMSRLGDATDHEALHDFRVGVRRVRSTLRSYRKVLPSDSLRKIRDELGGIARSTGDARDAEVQLEWVTRFGEGCERIQQPGVAFAAGRLRTRVVDGYRAANELVRARAPRALNALRAQLGDGEPGAGLSMTEFLARAVSKSAGTTVRRLQRISGVFDREAIHRARIATKRFRYLVEPLVTALPAAAPSVETLETIQDRLGDIHDLSLLADQVGRLTDELSASRDERMVLLESQPSSPGIQAPAEMSGLLLIASSARRHHQALFAEVGTRWLGDGIERSSGLFDSLSDHLATA